MHFYFLVSVYFDSFPPEVTVAVMGELQAVHHCITTECSNLFADFLSKVFIVTDCQDQKDTFISLI